MKHPILARAIEKLAVAGERAGFTVEQMIQILNAGVSVEACWTSSSGTFKLPEGTLILRAGSCSGKTNRLLPEV
jgi:hypothetical protein